MFVLVSIAWLMLAPSARTTPAPSPSLEAADTLQPKDLRRVEATEADVGPLRTSNRVLPADLRQPRGFGDVFQIPADAPTKYAGWFARADGAVIAVFPRSQYAITPDGVLAQVPSSAEFFIGGIPLDRAPGPPARGDRPSASGPEGAARIDTGVATADLSRARTPAPLVPATRVHPTARPVSPASSPGSGAAREAALSRLAARANDLFHDGSRRDQRVGRLLERALRPAGGSHPQPRIRSANTSHSSDDSTSAAATR